MEGINLSSPPNKRHGWVKTFSTVKGYGFIVDLLTGRDVFVHNHDLVRSSPGFRAIWRGEYVSFLLETTERGLVAREVTGILGGPLFCEVSAGAVPSVHPEVFEEAPALDTPLAPPEPEPDSEPASSSMGESSIASQDPPPTALTLVTRR